MFKNITLARIANPQSKSMFVSTTYKVNEFQTYKLQYSNDQEHNSKMILNKVYFIGPHPVQEL